MTPPAFPIAAEEVSAVAINGGSGDDHDTTPLWRRGGFQLSTSWGAIATPIWRRGGVSIAHKEDE